MLSNLLGWVVALGSLGLFLSGFFLPEVKRKNDPIWSGVGLIYALALWVNGDRTPGGLLLGEIASVTLLVWFGWQMVQQRRQLAPSDAQTPIPNSLDSLTSFLKAGWGQMQTAYSELSTQVQGYLGQGESDLEQRTPSQTLQKDWAGEDEREETPAPTAPVEPEPAATTPSTVAEEVPSAVEEVPTAEPPTAEPPISASPITDLPVQNSPEEPGASAATVAEAPVDYPVEPPIEASPEDIAAAEAEVPPEPEPVASAVTVDDVPPAEPEAVHETESSASETHPSDAVETSPEPSSEEGSEPSEPTPEGNMETAPPADAAAESEDDGSWPPPDPIT